MMDCHFTQQQETLLPELARHVDPQALPTQHGLYQRGCYRLVMGEGFLSSPALLSAGAGSESFRLADMIVRRREE